MSRITSKAKVLAAALGAIALSATAPAQAGDFSVSFGFSSPGVRPVYDHGYHPYGFHRGYRPASRFYDESFHPRPYHKRVVVKRVIEEDDEEECRVIVKKRYNDFGDLVIKRIRICD